MPTGFNTLALFRELPKIHSIPTSYIPTIRTSCVWAILSLVFSYNSHPHYWWPSHAERFGGSVELRWSHWCVIMERRLPICREGGYRTPTPWAGMYYRVSGISSRLSSHNKTAITSLRSWHCICMQGRVCLFIFNSYISFLNSHIYI